MRFLVVTPLLLLAACGGGKPAAVAAAGTPTSAAAGPGTADSDAAALGHELFTIMDQVMAFRSAHYHTWPRDLPFMGVDSLTHTTVRRLSIAEDVPTLVVAYRHTAGHAVATCSGTNKVIEDSMLNGGAFEVSCTLTSGESRTFTVGG